MHRRQAALGVAVVLVAILAWGGVAAAAEQYPSRPITFIVPWAAGGGTDTVARTLAVLLQDELGVPVNVVNRTGGGGAVGHTAGAQAPPDGYTITMATVELAMMHWMGLTSLTYRDFTPVAQVNFDAAGITVRADAPWQTLEDLIQAIRQNPGRYFASGTATGGIWDLARAGWLKAMGLPVDAVPWVPSTGAAPALQNLLAGGVDMCTCSLAEAMSLLRAGRVRALALMADERDPRFPGVPTLKEKGIAWSTGAWRGVMVPRATPADRVARLEAALYKAVHSETYRKFMEENGFGIVWRESKAFLDFVADQDQQFGDLMRALGLAK